MNDGPTGRDRSTVDEADLHALVDGQLDDGRKAAVLARLLLDRTDRERVEAYRRHRVALGKVRAGLERYGEGFAPELQRALADRLAAARRRASIARVAAAGLAASLVLGLGVATVALWRERVQPTIAIAYEPELAVPEFTFGGSFARYSGGTLEADRERSLAWLASHLRGQTLDLPDLRELGLKPVGGQVLDEAQAPAVRIAWADERGDRIDLYIGVVTSQGEQAFTLAGEGHVSLHWRQGPLVFALVGRTGSAKLLKVAHAVMHGADTARPATAPPPRVEPGPVAEDARPIRAVADPAAKDPTAKIEPTAPLVEPAVAKEAPAKPL
ncbi:MAG: hypothetical protein NZ555_11110 [Geminicoccaceae bacterium]|nr:hypothetical protein [Geminicoccaceae bacterium]MCX8101976.1 hypothetical protein [Geminicoccaceae bacterium]MDW8369630.1 hypothetical protein [Geminicoccaceae bacterium]